uniref:Uncharacterized protein n=1 Tax=Arundo donax TaxID=35708 RepID=A0A0A9C1Q3_ARUDO
MLGLVYPYLSLHYPRILIFRYAPVLLGAYVVCIQTILIGVEQDSLQLVLPLLYRVHH